MSAAPIVRQLVEAGAARAEAAVTAATARLAARAASQLPELSVEPVPGAVLLRGRGLLARAFGTRRRAADPRLGDLTMGDR